MAESKVDLTVDGLAAWLRKEIEDGGNREYEYIDNNNCLLCQYLKSQGVRNPSVAPDCWYTGQRGARMNLPPELNNISVKGPSTFLSALERAEKFLAGEDF